MTDGAVWRDRSRIRGICSSYLDSVRAFDPIRAFDTVGDFDPVRADIAQEVGMRTLDSVSQSEIDEIDDGNKKEQKQDNSIRKSSPLYIDPSDSRSVASFQAEKIACPTPTRPSTPNSILEPDPILELSASPASLHNEYTFARPSAPKRGNADKVDDKTPSSSNLFYCTQPNCTAAPFHTQYLLKYVAPPICRIFLAERLLIRLVPISTCTGMTALGSAR